MQTANNVPHEKAILEWLQQEMGYRPLPSAEALRKICRGNLIPVWKFLLETVKSERTVEKIRRNIHVHGSAIGASLEQKGDGIEGTGKERPKTPKSEREMVVPKTVGRERRRGDYKGKGRIAVGGDGGKQKEGAEREKESEKVSEGEESKEKALRDREAAASEVERLRHTMERLLKDIKGRMLDLSREEGERQRLLDDRSSLRHKQVLLEAYDQRCEQSVRIFAEYGRRLHGYVEHAREAQREKTGGPDGVLEPIRSRNEGDTMYATAITRGRVADEKQILIETAQERMVRRACEVLAANLTDKIKSTFLAFDGGASPADAQLEVAKLGFEMDGGFVPEEVKETAMSLLKNPPLLLRAMASYTAHIVGMIGRETEKIDIRADAERLRYRFENNRVLEDISTEVDDSFVGHSRSTRGNINTSKSSFRQLRERQRAHVQQFMATEDALNQAAEAKRLSDELVRRIHGAAGGADAAPSVNPKDGIQNAGSLRQFELEVWAKERELAGMRASVNTLTLEVQRLKKMCEERREAEEALRQKWKTIEEFDGRRMELESIYTALLRANMTAAASWEQHPRGSREYSASTIVPICESVQNKASAARDLLEREVAAFQRSPDNHLYMMPASPQGLLEAMGVSTTAGSDAVAAADRNVDLLVAKAGAGDPSAIPSICRISAALRYSPGGEGGDAGLASVVESMRVFLRPGASSVNLMEDLARAVNQVQTLRDLVGSGRSLLAAANSSRPEYERNATYCAEKSAEQEKIALEEWLPQLKAAVQEAQRCLEDCKRVRGLVDEWWEQPASIVVDWITVDGQNVAAWLAHVKQLQTAFYDKLLL